MKTGALAMIAVLVSTACDNGSEPQSDSDADLDSDGDSDADSDEDPDAVDETCDEPSTTRVVPCERCGSASQTCGEVGFWGPPGACMYQGECEPGEIETSPSPTCGEQQRLCGVECHWMEWEETVPGGECEPGQVIEVADACGVGWPRFDTCLVDCSWGEGPCDGDSECGGYRRTDPPLAEEICVPAGTFIRGETDYYDDTDPITEVYVSGFFIDRYPVTNERYRVCIEDGGCPELDERWSRYQYPEYDRRPVQAATYDAAVAFCGWDGRRRILTEAEWEKAARGPAPRSDSYVWGDVPDERCDLVVSWGCPTYDLGYYVGLPDDVDSLPGTASYYGVELMVGGGVEIVSDYYGASYYSDPASLDNPTGPGTGEWRTLRGALRQEHYLLLANRNEELCGPGGIVCTDWTTFRCGRDAPIRD